jgi:HK97 family phage prohead protease
MAMPSKYLSTEDFRDLARHNAAVGAAIERLGSVSRAAQDGSRVVTFCFTDGSRDRVGDSINPHGWQLSGFKANPVCLWAHDSSSPPIGRVRRTYVSGERLMGDIEFASAETYPFADQIYRLVVDGFVNAVSVGFLPIEWKWADDDDCFGIDFLRQELLEISVVPVPANANALVQAAVKSLGATRRSTVRAIRASAVRHELCWRCANPPLVSCRFFKTRNLTNEHHRH